MNDGAIMSNYELVDPQELIHRAIGQLKTASAEVSPERREAIEQTIKQAEEMLAIARSKGAKELGFRIHDCKYPAPLMLWDEGRKAHVCENCGHTQSAAGTRLRPNASWRSASRRGGGGDGTGWMGN
jgi:hypothetical protein